MFTWASDTLVPFTAAKPAPPPRDRIAMVLEVVEASGYARGRAERDAELVRVLGITVGGAAESEVPEEGDDPRPRLSPRKTLT